MPKRNGRPATATVSSGSNPRNQPHDDDDGNDKDRRSAKQGRYETIERHLRLEKILVNCFIFLLLLFFTIDALPIRYRWFQRLQNHLVVPVLDRMGLWQGPWHLFSPEPYQERIRFSADVWLGDETLVGEWKSPSWQDLPGTEKRALRRLQRYFRMLSTDLPPTSPTATTTSIDPEWEALARHIAQTQLPTVSLDTTVLSEPILVEIYYHRAKVLPPPPTKPTETIPSLSTLLHKVDTLPDWCGAIWTYMTNGLRKRLGSPVTVRLEQETERLVCSWTLPAP